MIDVSGQPRPLDQIEAALRCLQTEVVTNFMAKSKNGEPLVMHYVVVIDALRGLIRLRGEKASELPDAKGGTG